MKLERLDSLVKFYKSHLEGMGLSPNEFSEAQYGSLVTGTPLLEHCFWMLYQIEDMLGQSPDNIDKALGWMGFIQGCFAADQIFTIKEIRDQSR